MVGCVCVLIEGFGWWTAIVLAVQISADLSVFLFVFLDLFLYTIPCFIFVATLHIKINDIRPSMVTPHTLEFLPLQLTHHKVHTHSSAHTHTHTHTLWTHHGAVGKAIYTAGAQGAVGVSGLCSRGTSVVGIEGGERAIVHSLDPTNNTLPAEIRTRKPFTYESDSLTIGHAFLAFPNNCLVLIICLSILLMSDNLSSQIGFRPHSSVEIKSDMNWMHSFVSAM